MARFARSSVRLRSGEPVKVCALISASRLAQALRTATTSSSSFSSPRTVRSMSASASAFSRDGAA